MRACWLVAGLLSLAAIAPASAADAKAGWEQHCAKCHGTDGKGDTKMGKKIGIKDYTDSKVQSELKDAEALKNIADGMKEGDKTLMKPFGKTLTEEEIKDLLKYMRTFKK